MAIRKSRRQVVMSPSYIADLYAGRTAASAPIPAPAPSPSAEPTTATDQEAGGDAPAGRQFARPQDARQCEARARARTLGVKVAVAVEARKYVTASQSQPGAIYTIERTPVGWACSCEGYEFTGMCKHLGAVERRAEREGWKFGQIAPLSRVARYFPLDPQELIIRGAVLLAGVAA